MKTPLLLAATAAALGLAAPTAADSTRAADGTLTGTVGPGFSISLGDSSGAAVKHLDPGTYTLVLHDRADIHNFHLVGPGVNVQTDIDFVGDRTFTVTFADGSYDFFCDPHAGSMHGSFTVGTPPATTTPTATPLAARVGPGRTIVFPARLAAGRYAIAVRDLTARDNLHLSGPGVDRRTGVAFKGTARWTVTLRKGTYRISSDSHKTLTRKVVVG